MIRSEFVIQVGIVLLVVSCGVATKSSVPSQEVEQIAPEQSKTAKLYPPGVLFPKDFTLKDISISVSSNRLEFQGLAIAKISQIIGVPEKSIVAYKVNDREIGLDTYLSGGMQVYYSKQEGAVTEILVSSPDVVLGRGGTVGMSREKIMRTYQGGYETDSNSTEFPSKCYYFMTPAQKSGLAAVGYVFYFDTSDILRTVDIRSQGYEQ